jgi:hypothetical protein
MVWELWTHSKAVHKLPSELLRVRDEVAAYYLDRAVITFGQTVDARIQLASQDAKTTKEAQAKALRELKKWVRDPTVARFKDPATLFKK